MMSCRVGTWAVLLAACALVGFAACGGDDSSSGAAGAAGQAPTGGSAGAESDAATGGSAGTSETGGAAGAGTGGTGGTQQTGGSAGTAGSAGGGDFWGAAYDATCTSTTSHNAGKACVGCHSNFVLGGTVYSGGSGAAHVEVGVKGSSLLKVCSASDGNFYVKSGGPVDWSTAEIRIRNANGEKSGHPATPGGGDCNGCHGPSMKLTAP